MEKHPKYSKAHFHLGEAYFYAEHYNNAEESFRKAISLDNKYAAAYKSLYYTLTKKEQYKEALEVIHKSVEQVGYFFGGESDTGIKLNSGDIDIDAFMPVEKQPQPIKQPIPKYPELAIREGMEGTVFVKILVDEYGSPKQAIIYKSDNEVFNESAIETAMNSRFTLVVMYNGGVACWVVIPYRFKLK